jgi:hypothetical protein
MDLKSIAVFILTIHLITPSGKIIKQETHGVSCSSWWEQNVEEKQFKLRPKNMPDTYHVYNGEIVVGYICNNNLPQ